MTDATAEPELIDLVHLGRAHVIGAFFVGDVIVDPGPSSCLPALLGALGDREPRALALTHIHLDHAGAAGSLVRRFPGVVVWVHEGGAPHLVDPSKLLRSATRLYGEEMSRLWGEVLPVPAERVRALRGGESIGGFDVAYTPGHASHHVCYLHAVSGHALTGDVAGVRIDGACVVAPTPPPDIDLAAWRESLTKVAQWRANALAVTHFGAYDDVERHLEEARAALDRTAARARRLDEEGFIAATRAEIATHASIETGAAYEQAMPPAMSYHGLRRAAWRSNARARRAPREPMRRSPPSRQRTPPIALMSQPTNPEITPSLSVERLAGTFPGDLGVELTEITDEHVRGRMRVDRRHLHPGGFVHAGAWVGFADTVAAWGTLRHLPSDRGFTTVELKVNVLASASEGDVLEALGEPLHVGSRTQVWRVQVFRGERLAANFTCTQIVL